MAVNRRTQGGIVTLEIQDREFLQNLAQLRRGVVSRAVTRGIRRTANLLKEAASKAAPLGKRKRVIQYKDGTKAKHPGNLRKSMAIKRLRRKRRGMNTFLIGARTRAYYGYMLERGGPVMGNPQNPFFEMAVNTEFRSAEQAIIQELRQIL